MTQECLKSRTISVCLSNEHKSNGIRLKQCLHREVFKRIQRWESVSRQPIKTTFQRSFGKEETYFGLQKARQQRDILCLQYKNTCAVRACSKQLPRIRLYWLRVYRWADENLSANSQFILVKKITSTGYTLCCTGTEHLLSYDILLYPVSCSGSWSTAFSYPLNILYTFFLIYFIMLCYHNEDVSWFVSLIIETKSKEVKGQRNANQLCHSKIKINCI